MSSFTVLPLQRYTLDVVILMKHVFFVGMALPLSVGVRYGKALALTHNKPFIPVHHMEAHALTARMLHKVSCP